MGQQDCIFCKIVSGQIPSIKLYESDSVLAFMDIGPISDGHTLIIPKQHYARLDQAPPEMVAEISLKSGSKNGGHIHIANQLLVY